MAFAATDTKASIQKLQTSGFQIENIQLEQDLTNTFTRISFNNSYLKIPNILSGEINGDVISSLRQKSQISLSGTLKFEIARELFPFPLDFSLKISRETIGNTTGELSVSMTNGNKEKPSFKIQYKGDINPNTGINLNGTITTEKISFLKTLPSLGNLNFSLNLKNSDLELRVKPVINDEDFALPLFAEAGLYTNVIPFLLKPSKIATEFEFGIQLKDLNLDEFGYFEELEFSSKAANPDHINELISFQKNPSGMIQNLILLEERIDDLGLRFHLRNGFVYSPFLSFSELDARFNSSESLKIEVNEFSYNSEDLGNTSLSILKGQDGSSNFSISSVGESSDFKFLSQLHSGSPAVQGHRTFLISDIDSTLKMNDSGVLNIISSSLPLNRITGQIESNGLIEISFSEEGISLNRLKTNISSLFNLVELEESGMLIHDTKSEIALDSDKNNSLGINGGFHLGEVSISDIVLTDAQIDLSHNLAGQFLQLEDCKIFGGHIDSSPIYLGNLPEKIAIHLNINDIDSSKIAKMVEDFEGTIQANLDGQIAVIIEKNQFRFQHGALKLNNSAPPTLEWITEGLLTKDMPQTGFAYRRMKETEEAIAHLALNKLNVSISSQNEDESLMQVNIQGDPVDHKIKNPVILDFNFSGNWQRLVDYFLLGSGPGFQISVK